MKKQRTTRRRLLLFLCSLHVLIGSLYAQTSPQYMNANVTSTGCNAYPFDAGPPNNRIQWLIGPGELNGAPSGQAITVLWIKPCNGTVANYNLNIKLGASNLTSLPIGAFISTGMTTVFSGNIQMNTTADVWFPIPLQTNFSYDPTQSLIIEIENVNSTFGFSINQINLPSTRRLFNNAQGGDGDHIVCGVTLRSLGPNNAGITAITEPKSFCAGTYDVKVDVENAGTNILDSVRINWEIDGVAQPTIYRTKPIDTSGGSGGNKENITLGTVSFPVGIKKSIKIWTSHPNGVVDTVPDNDTLSISMQPSLIGTFTIGGTNPDYATFSDAVADLNAYGICGTVTFNVRAGVYNEHIELGAIEGTSKSNHIHFVGAGRGTTTLTYSGSDPSDWATVLLNGTDYVRFRDMTIAATGNDFAVAILLTDEADNNDFSNMDLDMSTTTINGSTFGILISGSPNRSDYGKSGNYNTFDSLKISGAYHGIWIGGKGDAFGDYCLGNEITNCELTDQYYYGLYTYYTGALVFRNNTIHNMRNAETYAAYLEFTNPHVIGNNTIKSPYEGLRVTNANKYNYDNVRSSIYNNMIYSAGDAFAGYFNSCYYMNFHHNTISGNTRTTGSTYFDNCNSLDVRNNIFMNAQSNTQSYSIRIDNTTFGDLDYNVYFTNGGNLAYHNNDMSDLDAWRDAYVTFNINSVNVLPKFVSTTDLHLGSSAPSPSGEDIGVSDDRDGDSRCTFAPTIGADESNFPYPTPVLSIGLLDSAFEGSLTKVISTFSTAFGEKVAISWYVDGAYVDKTKDLDYIFPSAGNYQVSVKVQNCAGSDSIGRTIQVFTPSSAPVTDFVASTTNPNLFDIVNFRDISKHGATAWTWTVTPVDGAIINGELTANPYMLFYYPGFYDVCLTTSNAVGQGTTLCKRTYISVRDEREMCDGTDVSTSATGRLTDDGGLGRPYASNRNCSFLINTCGQINLTFKEYNLADAQDELRIYDGDDNKAPLLGKFPGGSGVALPGGSTGITATNGRMYIEWVTSSANEAAGFEAYWVTIPDTSIKIPVADFTIPAIIYTGNSAIFQSTSQGKNLSYEWDFAPPSRTPGSEGGRKDFDRFSWRTSGTYDVKLKVTNCVGTHEIIKQVVVSDPTAAPTVNFYASKVRVPVLGKLQLFDSSSQGPTSWRWEISGGKARFETPATSQNPIVYFTAPGFYDVKLVAANNFGTDSVVKTAYIEVFNYCLPGVAVVNSDIGISRVQLGNIDNYTSVGVSPYSSYFEAFEPVEVIKRTNFSIRVERSTLLDNMSRKIWVDWNGDADFDDAGEEVAYETPALTKSYTVSIPVPVTATSGATVLRIGTSYSNGNNLPCGINPSGEFEDYPLMVKNDDILPVITLSGNDTVYIEQWYGYNEAGATATDNVDGNLSSRISTSSNIDSTQTGTYYVRYNVSDTEGNDAEEKVRVVIVTPDVTAPEIALTGNDPEKVTVSTPFNDPGATALDYFNRNISGSLSITHNINTNILGSYLVHYTVVDGGGNKDSVTRVVNVVDDIKPVITLIDNDTLYVEVGQGYNEPGYSVNDNFWPVGNIHSAVDSSGFNNTRTGTYEVVYTATDSSRNTQTATRWIIVRDLTLPGLELIGNDTVFVDVYTNYTEPGARVTDNYCTNGNWAVDTFPNINMLGDYTLTYTAEDCEGNNALSIKRVIKVVDRQAPVIELKGFENVNVQRWSNYTDAGIDTIMDNYYSKTELMPLVQVTSNVDVLYPGVYSVCYQVTDPSRNRSARVCRTVNVTESTTGIPGANLEDELSVYPNPNRGEFTIKLNSGFDEHTQIFITDALGRIVGTVKVNGNGSVVEANLNDLPAGIYFVQVKQGDRSASVKISITH